MISLKEYQTRAVNSLKSKVQSALRSPESEVVIFQAPTGSGKTLMVSETLKKLVRENKNDYAFIWISVRMLHEQSRERLEKYYENDRLIQCSHFEDLEDKQIAKNEILFINWDSINKKDINIYVKDNEQNNTLNAVVQNTKDEGRKIILIIDESHHTASSDKSKELIETIEPSLTLEVSATPHLKDNIAEIEKIHLADVKDEEMIKSEISINPEFDKVKIGSKDSDTVVIEQALKKREELHAQLKKEKSKVNPLVLIQLPDKKADLTDKRDEVTEILKKKFDITEKNGKLAVWVTEKKTDNLENIDKADDEIQVLVFKQAIALGWDCPRASILVIFRETKSFVFTIQTIGRIMRMPELKYYPAEEINKGYVFTNLSGIHIAEDYAKDYITIYESKRDNKKYKGVGLKSTYLKRQRERTRLSGKFIGIFKDVCTAKKLKSKIKMKPSKVVDPVITDGKITDIDKKGEVKQKGTVDVKLSEAELQKRFDRFVYDNCTPYAPIDSSDRLKNSIYQYFKDEFGIPKLDPKVQEIVLGKENVQVFVDLINISKEKYKIDIVRQIKEKRERIDNDKWEVPAIVSYNSGYKSIEVSKSIMKPFFVRKPSKVEEQFIKLIDRSKKVNWWYKNGEGEIKYFAIPYKDEDGMERGFYVDFIIQFKDSKIGLFDTKGGLTAKEAGPRSDGLQKYIKESKKKIWGGIVIFVNGTWRYFDGKKYQYNPHDLSAWKILEV